MQQLLEAYSHGPSHTRRFASALAPFIRPGFAVCLDGELGAGKTTFVSGLAAALGSRDEVLSPTFALEHRYALDVPERPGLRVLLHVDLYRTGDDARRDLLPTMLEARDEGAVLVVEWAAPILADLEPYLEISLRLDRAHGAAQHRVLVARAVSEGWAHLAALAEAWARIEQESS